MTLVPIGGLWETHITVSDLDRSIRFYRDVVGLTLAHSVPERHVAFFWIGQPRQAMLGLWSTLTSPMGMKLHYAFLGVEEGFNSSSHSTPCFGGWLMIASLGGRRGNLLNFQATTFWSVWCHSGKSPRTPASESCKPNSRRSRTLFRKKGFTLLDIGIAHLLTLAELLMHHRDPFDHLLIAQAIAEDASCTV